MRGQTYILLALFFAVVVAIFAVINVEPVEVNYLFGQGNAPLILVILVSVLMGGIITAAVGIVRLIKLQREIRHLKKENLDLQESIGNFSDASKKQDDKPLPANKIGQNSSE